MQLIDARGRILADAWAYVPAGEPLAPTGAVLVDFARFEAERDALLQREAPLGVRLPNTFEIDTLAGDLPRLSLIALEFPKFTDGRAYSQARHLRERHGYGAGLRAVGQVLLDQLLYLKRCGFDSFELAQPATEKQIARALAAYDSYYQPTGEGSPVILRERLRRAAQGAPS